MGEIAKTKGLQGPYKFEVQWGSQILKLQNDLLLLQYHIQVTEMGSHGLWQLHLCGFAGYSLPSCCFHGLMWRVCGFSRQTVKTVGGSTILGSGEHWPFSHSFTRQCPSGNSVWGL